MSAEDSAPEHEGGQSTFDTPSGFDTPSSFDTPAQYDTPSPFDADTDDVIDDCLDRSNSR